MGVSSILAVFLWQGSRGFWRWRERKGIRFKGILEIMSKDEAKVSAHHIYPLYREMTAEISLAAILRNCEYPLQMEEPAMVWFTAQNSWSIGVENESAGTLLRKNRILLRGRTYRFNVAEELILLSADGKTQLCIKYKKNSQEDNRSGV